ncbi:SWIM zinc finger family protein [Leucobacter sp. UT-8R-CII-1-4]|uniref:SWIM zinc finger family protein n=1 Tax=Leucobacter sp. UT-8R-CII-1-4 TaxID=3040075 RepID=UPI0024A89865|nr:SWIM zinc finger family protein [Leucobacter sp. UT-8R-CII-1-4]MDI6024573.1 SWIM zinc finger family protein [Leucobacter sp. UT-8R-CII-1-4]
MNARAYTLASTGSESALDLALAPALTPNGLDETPSFFHGFATAPRVVAQGLLTLADIAATRYFQPVPSEMRDPVLTAHGDRLRAEVFSADNGVYARFDLLGTGLDGGEIATGTTNVDIGPDMRRVLANVASTELFHLNVGNDGLLAATPSDAHSERPVRMPDRWVRALGNAAELHTALEPRFTVPAAQARAFIAALPPATGLGRDGWLTQTPSGIKVATRKQGNAVFVSGLNRLSALKRLLTQAQALTVYGTSPKGEPNTVDTPQHEGGSAFELELPHARMLITLTPNASRGYSGEGALLASLATPDVQEHAATLSALLSFDPRIDVAALSNAAALSPSDTQEALAVLAASGRVGWDLREQVYFHRELPDNPERVDRDNPRLVRARSILTQPGGVQRDHERWIVNAGSSTHMVRETTQGLSCTCVWFARHGTSRGPCAHALAVELSEHTQSAADSNAAPNMLTRPSRERHAEGQQPT